MAKTNNNKSKTTKSTSNSNRTGFKMDVKNTSSRVGFKMGVRTTKGA